MVFSLNVAPDHPLYQKMLAFVYWYTSLEDEVTELDINMYKVSMLHRGDRQRTGAIMFLECIKRLVQLVPVFGDRVNRDWTIRNTMDIAQDYYINSFMDKETYQAVW